MFTVDELMQDPRIGRLNKSGRDLVLAFTDALGGGGSRRSGSELLLKDWHRLAKADPSPSDVHVSTELTDMSVGYAQDFSRAAAGGSSLFPVDRQAGQFNIYDKGDLYRVDINASRRGPAAESAGGGYKITQGNYSCIVYAWHKDVDEQLMAQQIAGDPTDDATFYVTQYLMLLREAIFAANLLKTGLWTGGTGGATDQAGVAAGPGANQFLQFNAVGAVPREIFSAQAVSIHQNNGVWPNTLVLAPQVLAALLLNAEIVQAFQYTTAGAVPDMQALAKTLVSPSVAGFTPPNIVIAGGTGTTSLEGAADTFAYFAPKAALLAYVAPRPGLRIPTAYTVFAWSGLLGSNAFGIRMKDFELPRNGVPHRVEGEAAFDIKAVAAALGCYFTTAVA
jgi:hypothetical protein